MEAEGVTPPFRKVIKGQKAGPDGLAWEKVETNAGL